VIKVFVFLKRKPDLTHQEFRASWARSDPLVTSNPAFRRHTRRYVQNLAIPDAEIPGFTLSEFDGAAELWFDDVDELTAVVDEAHLHGLTELGAEGIVSSESTIRLVAEESVQFDRGFGEVKFMGLSRRHPSMTHEEWCRYWVEVHGPLAYAVPEFAHYYGKYVHNYVGESSGEEPEYDGIVEEWLESVDAMAACLAEPKYLEIVRPDELRFVDFSRSHMMLVEERVVVSTGEPTKESSRF
jgi:hypothetical protein